MRVRCHLHSQQVRGLDDADHLVVAELLKIAGVADREHATGGGELDQIRAVLVLVADGLRGFLRRVDDAVLPGGVVAEVRAQATLIAMPTGDAQRVSRCPDARPRDHAFVNRTFERHVRAALGANVPDGREACLERSLRVGRRTHCIVDRVERHCFDDGVLGAFARDVRVRIDEARHDRRAAEIDDLRTLRWYEPVLDPDDPIAGDQNRDALARRIRDAVDQATCMNDLVRFGLCRLLADTGRRRGYHQATDDRRKYEAPAARASRRREAPKAPASEKRAGVGPREQRKNGFHADLLIALVESAQRTSFWMRRQSARHPVGCLVSARVGRFDGRTRRPRRPRRLNFGCPVRAKWGNAQLPRSPPRSALRLASLACASFAGPSLPRTAPWCRAVATKIWSAGSP